VRHDQQMNNVFLSCLIEHAYYHDDSHAKTTCLLISLLDAEYSRTEENWVASNNRNIQVNRNSKETDNWQVNDQDLDIQEEEEYSSEGNG
jgi:hypothetical protein